jgi:hypothetical protein
VIVRHVEMRPPRGSAGQVRRAIAHARIGSRQNTLLLGKRDGRWEVLARSFDDARQAKGSYGLAMGCRTRSEIHVSTLAPDAETPRESVLEGPFGDRIRRAFTRGASLRLAGLTYAPDYQHIYLLRNARNRPRLALPVTVYKFGSFNASTALICGEKEAERIAHQPVPALLRQ